MTPTIHSVLREMDLLDLLTRLGKDEKRTRLAWDLETHTRGEGHNTEEWHPGSKVVALSLSWSPAEAWVVPFNHPAASWYGDAHERLADVAQAMKQHRLIAHNGKFDCRYLLATTGVDLAGSLWWDTMLASHVIDETRDSHSLKALAEHLAPDGRWDGLDMENLELVEWTPLAQYAGFDTAMTFALFEEQYPQFKADTDLARIFARISMRASRVLTRAERRGMRLDLDRHADALKRAEEGADAGEAALDAHARRLGMDPDTWEGKVSYNNSGWMRELMHRAEQEDEVDIVKYTPKGGVSWDKGALKQQAGESDVAADLLAYRDWDKQRQFLLDWRRRADAHGRVHGSWRIHGTRTGRLSSAGPNMQQVSRKLKPIWTASEGYVFVECDYSQVELRVAAQIAGCVPMLEAFNEGRDLHTMMAAIINDIPEDEVTKAQRQMAKATNFGFIYGMGAQNFVKYSREVYEVDVDLDEAEKIRNAFFATWWGLDDWHARAEWEAYENFEVRSPLGRVRRLPDAQHTNPYDRSKALRQGINSPVQAMASDLMLMAMDQIDRKIPEQDAAIVGTVHDSVLLEVRQNKVDKIVPKVAHLMMHPPLERFGARLEVPLVVDATIGTHWADEHATEMEFTP